MLSLFNIIVKQNIGLLPDGIRLLGGSGRGPRSFFPAEGIISS